MAFAADDPGNKPSAWADGDDVWIDAGMPYESGNILSVDQAEVFISDLQKAVAEARNVPAVDSDT